MAFPVVALGVAALSASIAALLDGKRRLEYEDESENQDSVGTTGVSAGGGPSGGGGGGPGVSVGPPGGGPGGGPGSGATSGIGPSVSVDPATSAPTGGGRGESFFGINAPFYFWPQNDPFLGQVRLMCESDEERSIEGREVFLCERAPANPNVTYGPPRGWLY